MCGEFDDKWWKVKELTNAEIYAMFTWEVNYAFSEFRVGLSEWMKQIEWKMSIEIHSSQCTYERKHNQRRIEARFYEWRLFMDWIKFSLNLCTRIPCGDAQRYCILQIRYCASITRHPQSLYTDGCLFSFRYNAFCMLCHPIEPHV